MFPELKRMSEEEEKAAPKKKQTQDDTNQGSAQGTAGKKQKKSKLGRHDANSMVDLEIPNAELISPFQIVDKEETVASSRNVQHSADIRPSYIEGLTAIVKENLPQDLQDALQLDHSREYMERKYREWQKQQVAESADHQLLQRVQEQGVTIPDHSGGTFKALTPGSTGASSQAVDKEKFPYRGSEFTHLARCSHGAARVWQDAYHAFPKLKARLSYRDAISLMKALVLNELQNYKAKNLKRDEEAQTKPIDHQSLETLGFTQMTPKAVRELELGLAGSKKVRNEFPQLTEFFARRGYSGNGHEALALIDPVCAPIIVAAKLETVIEIYERSQDKFSAKPLTIDARTLAYGFKPDVLYNPKDIGNPDFHTVTSAEQALSERMKGYEVLFPCTQNNVLSQSQNLAGVKKWVQKLTESY